MRIINTKETDAWTLITKEDETHTRYEIFTRAWFWRGGKSYFNDKIIRILEWTAMMTWELEWKDYEVVLTPENWEFKIPNGIPHIFYFPEDTKMVEDFPRGTKTEKIERYRAFKK